MVQLLHPYMTTGKTIALTRWTSISMQAEPIASRGEGIHWNGPCVTLRNERCVPHLAACAFPGKTSLLSGIQFIVRRALLLMPLWLALGLVNIGMSCWSKGTMPSWQMDSCAGMLWNQQVHQVWKRQTRREFQKVRAETEAQETQGCRQGSAKSFEIFWKWNEVDQCPLKALQKNLASKKSSTHSCFLVFSLSQWQQMHRWKIISFPPQFMITIDWSKTEKEKEEEKILDPIRLSIPPLLCLFICACVAKLDVKLIEKLFGEISFKKCFC